MQVNLLPNGAKKEPDEEKNVKSAVHEVPMSTPIPLDKSVVSEPVELKEKSDSLDLQHKSNIPVARKYATIQTEQDTNKPAVPPVRDNLAPKYIRDRSGRKMPVVFAPRRNINLSDPVSPNEKVKIDHLPHESKKHEPGKMLETEAHNLSPSAKENFLEKLNQSKPVETAPPKITKPEPNVPVINKVRPTVENKEIPKKPITPTVRRKVERSETPSLILMVLLSLVVGAGLWWGVLYWHDSEASSLANRAEQLSLQLDSDISEGAGLKIKTQLDTISDWLNNLPDYSAIFAFLERTVLEDVQYTAVAVKESKMIELTGYAPNMLNVSQQYLVFEESEDVENVDISQTSLQDNGIIEFVFNIKLQN